MDSEGSLSTRAELVKANFQPQAPPGSCISLEAAATDSSLTHVLSSIPENDCLPKPQYDIDTQGLVMTPEQLDTLRRQICAYSTICQQLIAMYQAMATQIPVSLSGAVLQHNYLFESSHIQQQQGGGLPPTTSTKGKQRWTPQPAQLQILENFFANAHGTPGKHKIKEIAVKLNQLGPISETNVYNWFQNRKARAKRKHSSGAGVKEEAENEEGENEGGSGAERRIKVKVEADGDAVDGEGEGEEFYNDLHENGGSNFLESFHPLSPPAGTIATETASEA